MQPRDSNQCSQLPIIRHSQKASWVSYTTWHHWSVHSWVCLVEFFLADPCLIFALCAIPGGEFRLWHSALCRFLPPSVTFCFPRRKVCQKRNRMSVIRFNTVSVSHFCVLSSGENKFHVHTKTGWSISLHILIFRILPETWSYYGWIKVRCFGIWRCVVCYCIPKVCTLLDAYRLDLYEVGGSRFGGV
jgi:hypothetical protein